MARSLASTARSTAIDARMMATASIAVNIDLCMQTDRDASPLLPSAARRSRSTARGRERLARRAEGDRRPGPAAAAQPDPGPARRRGLRLPPDRAARPQPADRQPPPEGAPRRPGSSSASSAAAGPTTASSPSRSATLRESADLNVLFVCVGNQGRSVMAERLFRRAAAGRHATRSAGSEPGLGNAHRRCSRRSREVGDRRLRPRPAQAGRRGHRLGGRRGRDLRRRLPGRAREALRELGDRRPCGTDRARPRDPRRDRASRRRAAGRAGLGAYLGVPCGSSRSCSGLRGSRASRATGHVFAATATSRRRWRKRSRSGSGPALAPRAGEQPLRGDAADRGVERARSDGAPGSGRPARRSAASRPARGSRGSRSRRRPAPVARTCCGLAVAELARRLRLRRGCRCPALPQQIACSAGSTRSRPGIESQQRARRVADPLRVAEVARVLEGDAERAAGAAPPAARSASSSETSTTRTSSSASFRCEPQPAALTTIASTPRERARRCACARRRPSSRRPACRWSAPQQRLAARRDHLVALRGEHPRGRRVDVAEDDALHAAGQQADPRRDARPPPASPRAAARASATAAPARRAAAAPWQRQPAGGASASAARSRRGCGKTEKTSARSSRRRPGARTAPRRRSRVCSISRSYGRRTGTRSRTPCSRGSGRSARRRSELSRHRAVGEPLHQLDPAARRVHLLLPERPVGRAGRQAEAAVRRRRR